MTVTLELPPEVEASFVAQARAKGVPIDAFLQDYLIQHAPPVELLQMSTEEWERAFEEWADSFPDVPPLSDEAVSRESIYTREDEW